MKRMKYGCILLAYTMVVTSPSELDVDWTFPDAETQYLTHGLQKYPARMIPQIPSTLLDYFLDEGILSEGDVVYDPFMGSGTTTAEARLHGLHAKGNDINPFACTISSVKSTPIDPEPLAASWDAHRDEFRRRVESIATDYDADDENPPVETPEVRDGWFPEPQLHQLVGLKEEIDRIEDDYPDGVSDFYRVSLAGITRNVSYQRNGEFKRYRIPEDDRQSHTPDVWSLFTAAVTDNIPRIEGFYNAVDQSQTTEIWNRDSRTASDFLGSDAVDAIITSPPYGDHGTTVAYGQFSQDPAIVSDDVSYDAMKAVDKDGLGGRPNIDRLDELEDVSETLSETLDTLAENDGRHRDAVNFFKDYFDVMTETETVLKSGAPIVWVVANRTMSRVNIPLHLITKELCEHLGFTFVDNIPREIPNTTMPTKNAPENIPGHTDELMANENIIILEAP